MTQEALKLALDALETELSIDWTNNDEFNTSAEKMYEAIAAIKQALAQPKQEPVAWELGVVNGVVTRRPIAPPRRTWVGLTNKEVFEICYSNYYRDSQLVKMVEAKLKEKNGA